MSMTIRYELQLLAASLTVGICLMMVYDGLRLFRTLIPHGNFWTALKMPFTGQAPALPRFSCCLGRMTGYSDGMPYSAFLWECLSII